MITFDLGEESEYATWIRSGHMPLIVRFQEGSNGPVRWKLIRSHDPDSGIKKKYVAMSHVGVDGTGSTNGNSLFSCQLEKFQNAANKLWEIYGDSDDLEGPIPFWVDTICVPFNKGPLKMLAIREMAQVYRNADKVLVFDSGLQQVSLNTPASECLTQIEISSWNERLWTIQEAVFAKALYFQFKDGLIGLQKLFLVYRLQRFGHIASLLQGVQSEGSWGGMALLKIVLESHLEPVLKKGENAFSQPPGVTKGKWVALDSDALGVSPSESEIQGLSLDTIFLGTIVAVSGFFNTLQLSSEGSKNTPVKWSSLEKVLPYRQTSIASDEGLCISTLLGMDLTSLFDLPDVERVRRMFLHIGTIRSSILFGSRPRLELPGYRWMPSSSINQRIELSDKPAHVTSSGVKVKLHSLSITFPPGGFLLPVQPGNRKGTFGFQELDEDDEDGPGHLIASAFPIHISGTNNVYTVWLTLPDGFPGIVVSKTGMLILLEDELVQEDAHPTSNIMQRIFDEWEFLQKKSMIEGFLVNQTSKEKHVVEYSLPATLTSFDDPTPGQIEAAALAIPCGEEEWLVS
jgi:hypothetical protein